MDGDPAPGEFAGVLRRLRESRSLTQEELAERARLTVKAVGALERGERRRPYPHTVRSLADALDLSDPERAELVGAVPSRAAPDAPAAATLPLPTTIGRDADIGTVLALLADGHRLLTLTGPGGVGKTRLAQEVLRSASADHPGGTAFVDLAAVREPGSVLPRLAAALGVPDSPGGTTPARVAQALTGRRCLAVLDNLEQVLGAAGPVAEVVALTPGLTVLATSRAPLRVRAEHEVPVAPLDLPRGDDLDAVAASPAVRLLRDRALASGGDLALTEDTAPVVAAIARRLDGIPLALELAGAATRLLPPQALLARLEEHGLDPGVAGPRDLPDRQRTMTAVLDWSADLLDPADAELLGRLAAFSGGFSLGSAEAVAGGDEPGPTDVLPGIGRLVEQSLVTTAPSPDGEPRFRLLEPVRQYAAARLRGADAAATAADAHAAHFRGLASAAHHRLQQARVGPALDRLEADHANLRAAFLRLLDLERTEEAAELVGGIWLYLAVRGRVREGLEWLERLGGAGSDAALVWAGVARMGLLLVVGDVPGMRREASVTVPLSQRSGDPLLATEASMLAGLAEVFGGDAGAAEPLLRADEAPAGDAWVAVHRQLGRGQAALVVGDVGRAGRLLDAAVDGARELGNEFSLATALNTAATLAEVTGDDVRAAVLLGEALALSARLRLHWSLGYSLPALAGVAGRVGDPVVAATLFGAAATLTASASVDTHFPPSRETSDRGLATCRDALGEAAFLAAWEAGRSATPEEVAELAHEVVADLTRPGRG